MDHHWRLRAMDHHWRLLAMDHHWKEEMCGQSGTWSCHRAYQAGETCKGISSGQRHRTHQAGETYRRPCTWQRHRIHWAMEVHWRSRSKSLHHPSWLDRDFGPVRAGRMHRTHWAVQTHCRHRVASRSLVPLQNIFLGGHTGRLVEPGWRPEPTLRAYRRECRTGQAPCYALELTMSPVRILVPV
jgi:hypothetical protein